MQQPIHHMISERRQPGHLVIHRQRHHRQRMKIGHQRMSEYLIPVNLIREHRIARDIELIIPIGETIRKHRRENNPCDNGCTDGPIERVIGDTAWFGRCGFLLLSGGGLFWLAFAHDGMSENTNLDSYHSEN